MIKTRIRLSSINNGSPGKRLSMLTLPESYYLLCCNHMVLLPCLSDFYHRVTIPWPAINISSSLGSFQNLHFCIL